jgi:hypothetical protein
MRSWRVIGGRAIRRGTGIGLRAVSAGQVDSMALPVGGANSRAVDNRARIVVWHIQAGLSWRRTCQRSPNSACPLSTGLRRMLYAPARAPGHDHRLNEAVRETTIRTT